MGVGLGLAIARGFTEAMGGTLEPAHTPGGGLTMTVTLPRADVTVLTPLLPASRMTRILVVDDDAGLARALAINLRAHGYEVETAPTAQQALAAASARPPDLVVLDLGLPDIDGVEVVSGLRGWCTAPILVLSARNTQEQKVAALDAGADDYVTKPFGMDELLARVRAALRRARQATPSRRRGNGIVHRRPARPPRSRPPTARCV